MMKVYLQSLCLALVMVAIPMMVNAQQVNGLYVGGGLGANFHSDVTAKVPRTATTIPFTMKVETRPGFVGIGSLGWGFGNGLRTEIEGSIRTNDVRSAQLITSVPLAGHDVHGVVRTYGMMANGFYDLDLPFVKPYVGGGIGVAWHNWDSVGVTDAVNERVRFNDYAARFGYQGIAGLAVPIPMVPGLEITAEYRYFATLDATFKGKVDGLLSQGLRTKVENQNHAALLGVRFVFGK